MKNRALLTTSEALGLLFDSRAKEYRSGSQIDNWRQIEEETGVKASRAAPDSWSESEPFTLEYDIGNATRLTICIQVQNTLQVLL